MNNEPFLLVGETATGKTSPVKHLAETLHQKLVVSNSNSQTESADLIAWFKPAQSTSSATGCGRTSYVSGLTFVGHNNILFIQEFDASIARGEHVRFV